jgi:phospholipid transport system transporter-binding protein
MATDTPDSVVRLPERVTLQEAVQVLDALSQTLGKQSGAQVTLDASGLRVFDTSAVAVLLTLRSNMLAQGKKLSVDGWPQRLTDLAKLYGVSELLAA